MPEMINYLESFRTVDGGNLTIIGCRVHYG